MGMGAIRTVLVYPIWSTCSTCLQVSGALVAGAGCTLQQCDDAAAEVSQPAFHMLPLSRDQTAPGQDKPQHSRHALQACGAASELLRPCAATAQSCLKQLHLALALVAGSVHQLGQHSQCMWHQRLSLSRVQLLNPALHRQGALCPWTLAPERIAT